MSDDLTTWRRLGTAPALDIDPRWQARRSRRTSRQRDLRDPQVLRDPGGDGWHMLVTARRGAHRNDDGVVGHAGEPGPGDVEVRPPLSESGTGFGQTRGAPGVRQVDGQWVLVFMLTPPDRQAPRPLRGVLHVVGAG